MNRETIKTVHKVWGYEKWIVNQPEYCGKLLVIEKGSAGSLHFHRKKKETFYCLSGRVFVIANDSTCVLSPESSPLTLEAGDVHQLRGLEFSVILEVSTKHSDRDVVRLEKSKGA